MAILTLPFSKSPAQAHRVKPRPFLSLRWQALIALSLVLLLVNGTLTLLAYRHSMAQFELQQSQARANQARQLQALLGRNYEEMTRLVTVLPLLGPPAASAAPMDFADHLRLGLESEGSLVGLEWDLRLVMFIPSDGQPALRWPEAMEPPSTDLLNQLDRAGDDVSRWLTCQPECLQFLAAPILWHGQAAGTLVLGRSIADALLAFNALTGSEVAVISVDSGTPADTIEQFPAMTHPDRTGPIIRAVIREQTQADAPPVPDSQAARIALSPALHGNPPRGQPEPVGPDGELRLEQAGPPLQGEIDGRWYEVFRVDNLGSDVGALIVDEVTAARVKIQSAVRDNVLIGIVGLALSGVLLFWIGHFSVGRLRRIALALPLLAENRFEELRAGLPAADTGLKPTDELDQLSTTAQALTDRMERLKQEREEAEARLVWLADHDPLTRLLNRRRFSEDFTRVLDQASRYGQSGAMLLLDLDHFKDVNDLSGHQIGDILLQRVADSLSRLSRPSDVLARLGGDEFALVLAQSSAEGAVACAERIQAAIQRVRLLDKGRVHQVTASIGIALFPQHGVGAEDLTANTDIALFQAKEKGRGRFHIFSAADQVREQADARITWRDQITLGLRDNRFELHFQPIVTIATGTADHWESLLRLRDPLGTLIFPERFIPVAEKTGQIRAIDHWVMTEAIRQLGQNQRLRLAVNLSGSALNDPSTLPVVERLLTEAEVDPTRLLFEITETVAVSNLDKATELMHALKQLGCDFALDDFGTGYASYAYLRRLPVDEVKIDGAFVRDLANNREDRIFVQAITDMAHGMGKRVTAEFVENETLYRILGELGVDQAQGYFLGEPCSPPEYGPWPKAARS